MWVAGLLDCLLFDRSFRLKGDYLLRRSRSRTGCASGSSSKNSLNFSSSDFWGLVVVFFIHSHISISAIICQYGQVSTMIMLILVPTGKYLTTYDLYISNCLWITWQ
jgi:hypothetical protein